jgi:DNA-binding NarL/FixJ family response regulator
MKVLIVDDHPIVRSGLRRLLNDDAQVLEAATGKAALRLFWEHAPDLVILDLNLPDLGGLEVIRRLRLAQSAAYILVLTMLDDPIHSMRALEAGATGYVSKNARPEQILEAITRVASGHAYLEHGVAQSLALMSVHGSSHPLKDLSSRDLDIIRQLGEGRSLHEIADGLGLSYKTIANTCSQIKTKLNLSRTADLIRLSLRDMQD